MAASTPASKKTSARKPKSSSARKHSEVDTPLMARRASKQRKTARLSLPDATSQLVKVPSTSTTTLISDLDEEMSSPPALNKSADEVVDQTADTTINLITDEPGKADSNPETSSETGSYDQVSSDEEETTPHQPPTSPDVAQPPGHVNMVPIPAEVVDKDAGIEITGGFVMNKDEPYGKLIPYYFILYKFPH
ncbi:uncharacterized protein MELLADRAFT_114319 [Melampsora larici-populina 98AG31]|uniref:Uncharacterized protein n=1 Tax=Melampsora larici-populina (strain 98AG31 / pathotype 3-4-7) TaxID=747676 RepID=F4SD10_MELLP|nr:uncharacterized protein MELLADRAFT_114319 [Melampsora larici-populina 98AG31]EGF97474.1 hypothetical protein MELLADRAFT_114319 [Melampsora larici-populina 98AG31]